MAARGNQGSDPRPARQGRTGQPEGAVAALQQGGNSRLDVRVGVLPAGLALVHSHAHLLPEHGRAVLGQPLPQL